MATQDPNTRLARKWAMLLLAVIMLAALGLRYRGIAWAHLHPDEYKIAQWAFWIEENSYISERFYAGGYFQLIKPMLWARNRLSEVSASWRAFKGWEDGSESSSSDMIIFLRTINLWLAVITVGLFYLLARRVTASRGAALAAAGFLALARLHVEHSHYGETDIALLFTLAAALYAWVRAHDGGRLGWFLAAAFLSGWAIGTKFTVSMLLPNVLVGAMVIGARGAGCGGKTGRMMLLTVGGVALCLAAVVFTNQGMLNFKWFWPHAMGGLSSVYGERTGLLGQSARDPDAAWIFNAYALIDGLTETGWIWGLLMLAGLAFALAPSYRRFWPVTILFPFLYGWYFVFIAPWNRGQEFMIYFPVMALWIAIGVRELAARATRLMPCAAAVSITVIVVLAAMAGSGVQACRTASLFGWPDPRIQALEWLHCHAHLDASVGVEQYTFPVEYLFSRYVNIEQVEWLTLKQLRETKIDYLCRNVSSSGRGTVDPHTLKMYPRFTANLQDFEAGAHRLCQWGALDNPPYMFVGHRIEWWDARPVSPVAEFTMPLFRAVCLRNDAAVMAPEVGGSLGSAPGIWVDRHPRRLVLSGPASDDREVYVVVQTSERPAEVVLAGSGCRREVALAPYDVAIVPIRRPAYWPRLQEYDVITVQARPVQHIEYIPCYADVAFSVSEAAMLAFQKGYADRALAFLKAKNACRHHDVAWLAYACAVETDDWRLAAELEAPAREMLSRLEAARAVKPDALLINGYSGVALQDHRRIRLPFLRYDRDSLGLTFDMVRLKLEKKEDPSGGFQVEWPLQVSLARGRYRVRFTIAAKQLAVDEGPWLLTVADSVNRQEQDVVLCGDASFQVVREVTANSETRLAITLQSAHEDGPLGIEEC